MTPSALIDELADCGITVHADGDQLRLEAGRGTLTPKMLSAVKTCKQGLLNILRTGSLLPGLSGSGSRSADAASVPRAKYTTSSNKIDCEFDRFEQVAVATETGGWRNPEICSAELAKQIRIGGIAWEGMERLETDCGRMGRESGAHSEKASEYRRKAGQLEDFCNV